MLLQTKYFYCNDYFVQTAAITITKYSLLNNKTVRENLSIHFLEVEILQYETVQFQFNRSTKYNVLFFFFKSANRAKNDKKQGVFVLNTGLHFSLSGAG